jgi:hypothetical protein
LFQKQQQQPRLLDNGDNHHHHHDKHKTTANATALPTRYYQDDIHQLLLPADQLVIAPSSLSSPSLSCTMTDIWALHTKTCGAAIHDTLETLYTMFGEDFRYADADQTALFMQMKEAFRVADLDCNGEIDTDEVKRMLQNMFQDGGGGTSRLSSTGCDDAYVKAFMECVDTDRSGKVSFEEFMHAIEKGLTFEVHVVPFFGSSSSFLGPERPIDITRSHDILNVDTVSLLEKAQRMRRSYAAWLLENNRFQSVPMEELLLLNGLMSGMCGIARNLALLEEMTIQP